MSREIDVCLCTFRRADVVGNCLRAVLGQRLPGGVALGRVIVVDNDASGSAREAVRSATAGSGAAVVYDIVATPGIALARNRCLTHVRAERFAFLDDDEVPEPGWLAALDAALEAHGADFVQGPVVPRYGPDTPGWVIASGAFERPRPPTGTPIRVAATNNVLLRTAALDLVPGGFDVGYGQSGGEDTAFFDALSRAGARGVACDEAVVSELVEPERMSLGYLMRRSMSSGQNYYNLVLAHAAPGWRWRYAAKKLGHGLAALALAIALAPFGRARQVRWLREAAKSVGVLRGFLGATRKAALYRRP